MQLIPSNETAVTLPMSGGDDEDSRQQAEELVKKRDQL